jgi:hypothetical protein
MNRQVRHCLRWTLVLTLTIILSTSPVSAGWLLHRMHCAHQVTCCPPPTCEPQWVPVCPPPECMPEPYCPQPVVEISGCPSGCGESVPMEVAPLEGISPEPIVEYPMIEGTIIESELAPWSEATPIEPAVEPMEPRAVESPSDAPSEAVPPKPTETQPTPAPPVPPAPTEPPAETEKPADDLFGAPQEEPGQAAPAEQPPADDIFAPPAQEAPADDLFGAPPAEAAPAEEAPMDDLFGAPPAEEAAPAGDAPALDDLFGAPADAPAAAPAANDIFGAPPADAPAAPPAEVPPAEAPPAEGGLDDLFGSPANDSPAAEPAGDGVDDLFGGADAGAEEAAPANAIDDLFGAIPAAEDAGYEELPAPKVQQAEASGVVRVVASEALTLTSMADTPFRTWIDNTGRFRTDGRLVEIGEGQVRLLKSNGRTCTVTFSRLSEADLAYVASVEQQLDQSRIALLSAK